MKNKLIEIVRAMSSGAFTNEEKADYLLQHDVVQVVRCEDCEKCRPIHNSRGEIYDYECEHFAEFVTESDYCSYGIRRTENR